MKTGWSRESIVALPPAEFNHYLEVIINAKAAPE